MNSQAYKEPYPNVNLSFILLFLFPRGNSITVFLSLYPDHIFTLNKGISGMLCHVYFPMEHIKCTFLFYLHLWSKCGMKN